MEENVTTKVQGSVFGMKINKEKKYFMMLTDQPRLFLLSEFKLGRDDIPEKQEYKKDILLYLGLKCRLIKKNIFSLDCKLSGKSYQFKSEKAGDWVVFINQQLARFEREEVRDWL